MAEREDSLLQVVFYRAGSDTGDLVMEDRKESSDHLSDSQASVSSGFPGTECL